MARLLAWLIFCADGWFVNWILPVARPAALQTVEGLETLRAPETSGRQSRLGLRPEAPR